MRICGLLLTVSFVVFSFGGNSSQGAEDTPPANADVKPDEVRCRCVGAANPATVNIMRILANPLLGDGLDFTEEPLESVVSFLQSEYEIPIQLDEPALEDVGLTRDEKITVQFRNVSLRSALRLMLKQKQLTYVLRDETLIITTPEEAESELVTCVYDVRDLVVQLPPGRDGQVSPDYDSLIDAIVSCVAKETWSEWGGGEAVVRPLPQGLLVISQTQEVHEQLADLLITIRATLRRPASPPAGRSMRTMGRGGYGMSDDGMGGFGGGRGGYGGRGGMEGTEDDLFGGDDGEMGAEPTAAEADPFAH